MIRRGIITLSMVADIVYERCERDERSGRWADFVQHCRRRYGLHPGQCAADKIEVMERMADRF